MSVADESEDKPSGCKRLHCGNYSEARRTLLPDSLRREARVYDRGMKKVPASDVTAFILAGGKSSRMGRDKAFVNFEGRTLLARALDLAGSVSSNVRIVGSHEKFAPFGSVVEDIFRDCGPLGGIHAALRSSATELNVLLAVDTPFVSREFLEYLIGKARAAPEAAVVVPRCDGGLQPLCAVYREEFAAAAENALNAGRNRIDLLFDMVPTRMIEEEELEAADFPRDIFRNLNAPQDLHAQKRKA